MNMRITLDSGTLRKRTAELADDVDTLEMRRAEIRDMISRAALLPGTVTDEELVQLRRERQDIEARLAELVNAMALAHELMIREKRKEMSYGGR